MGRGSGEGTSHLYTMTRDDLRAGRSPALVARCASRSARPAAVQDQRRLQEACSAGGGRKSQEFFSSSAGQWDRLRDDLFGERFHLAALAALADPRLGGRRPRLRNRSGQCGAGAVRRAGGRGRRVGGDAAGGARALGGADNVDLRRGELEALPIDDARLDVATLMLVLHHVPEPAGRWQKWRASSSRAAVCCWSTCCRTNARATASRWAMSGSVSLTNRCGGCWPTPASRYQNRAARRRTPRRRDPGSSSATARRQGGRRASRAFESTFNAKEMIRMATVTEKLHAFAAARLPAGNRSR